MCLQSVSQPHLFEKTSSYGLLVFYLPSSLSRPRVILTCPVVTKKYIPYEAITPVNM